MKKALKNNNNKKRTAVKILSGVLALGVLSLGSFLYITKDKQLILRDDNKEFSWTIKGKNSLKSSEYFVINRNGEDVKKTQDTTISDSFMIDTASPNKISDIAVNYKKDSIEFKWQPVSDKATQNNYKILLKNKKGSTIGSSNIITKEYSSGIKNYQITDGTKTIKLSSDKTSYEKKLTDTAEGRYKISVSAVDGSGNAGEPFTKEYDYFIPYVERDIVKTKDETQEYKFKLIYNDKTTDIPYNTLPQESFVDKAAPNPLKDAVCDVNYESVSINWNSPDDNGTEYLFSLSGEGITDKNIVYLDNAKKQAVSGIKGYYYAVNKIAKYTATSSNDFTEKNLIQNLTLPEGIYYVHIAAVDKSGNVSTTFTKQFKTLNKEAEEKRLAARLREDNISHFFVNEAKVSDASFNNFVSEFFSLPGKLIDSIKTNTNLKIYITKTITAENNNPQLAGVYYTKSEKIEIRPDSEYGILLHEIGHCIYYEIDDRSPYKSDEFNEIYKKEASLLFPGSDVVSSHVKSDAAEYYAESFKEYIANPKNVQANAPNTFNYMKALVDKYK